jgi:hypothetical protein
MDTTKWITPEDEEDEWEDDPVCFTPNLCRDARFLIPQKRSHYMPFILQFLNLNKDTILFCIDGSSSMHAIPDLTDPRDKKGKAKPLKGKSLFQQALQCALDVMRRKVIICPNDSVGIMFFNTVSNAFDNNLGFLMGYGMCLRLKFSFRYAALSFRLRRKATK